MSAVLERQGLPVGLAGGTARTSRLRLGESEPAPLERINEIYARLKRGDVKGRVVLTPAAA